MSEAYKQKEYEVRSAIDSISSIPYVFENYVEETENFIDRLLDDTKEINTLRNQLQQKENIIKEVREYLNHCSILGVNEVDSYCIDYDVKDDLLRILDKENNNE